MRRNFIIIAGIILMLGVLSFLDYSCRGERPPESGNGGETTVVQPTPTIVEETTRPSPPERTTEPTEDTTLPDTSGP